MDGFTFDRLVRLIATDGSRRGLLRSVVAAAATGIGVTALGRPEEAEAKSCKKKCKEKQDKDARRKCKKKCKQQAKGKANGALCDDSGECAAPNICALPLGDSGGDKRCCGATGAPCGGDNEDLDDQPPICCQGFVCSTNNVPNGGPGTCVAIP